jgi:hypothetical protein
VSSSGHICSCQEVYVSRPLIVHLVTKTEADRSCLVVLSQPRLLSTRTSNFSFCFFVSPADGNLFCFEPAFRRARDDPTRRRPSPSSPYSPGRSRGARLSSRCGSSPTRRRPRISSCPGPEPARERSLFRPQSSSRFDRRSTRGSRFILPQQSQSPANTSGFQPVFLSYDIYRSTIPPCLSTSSNFHLPVGDSV